ncbi:MAG: hypothetical protein Q9167_001947 [Letrouitia subvulpina]
MTSLTHTRPHGSHSHAHHHHHHDNTYLTSANKNDAGVRITRIGLFVNLFMAMGKGIGGYVFNSQALVADAFHALTDLVSDFMTLGTVAWSLKPPTARFPSGYGKIESLGSLGVSGLLLTGGVLMGLNSGDILYHELLVNTAHDGGHSHGGIFGHSHSHGATDLGPNINAAWLAAGSIVVKEYLYRATMKIAKQRKSSVLASNAVHHRIDCLTSVVALAAIGGAHLFSGTSWLDPVGGLIVSFMVIRAGWANTGQALLELADVGVDEEIKTSVHQAATRAISLYEKNVSPSHMVDQRESDVEVRGVQGIKAGQNYLVDIELAVPESWEMRRLCVVEDMVRSRVGSKVRGVRRVKIRMVPKERKVPEFSEEYVRVDTSTRSNPESEDETEHMDEHKDNRVHVHEHEHSTTGEGLRERR